MCLLGAPSPPADVELFSAVDITGHRMQTV
jgi:hypothetical protein